MALSDELVSQFAKLMKPEEDKTQESTLYGKFVIHNGKKYVQLDGSELLTPVEQTATAKEGDRVSVTIKNHNATVTGNYSSPAARSGDVDENSKKILEVGTLVAGKASIEDLKATNATVGNLVTDNATIKKELKAANATIETISADNVTIKETLKANKAAIDDLDANKLSANVADLKYATIEKLEATNADIHNLSADYGEFKQATVDDLSAKNATIQKLQTEKLSATDADLKYANIDFSNIGKAAIEQFYATSGIIKDLVVGDETITGELVGVTIKGDLIEGGTVVADKLVIKGQNGLYYKLNTDGVTTEAEQTDYNSLNGSVITAKSITASKVNVKDLVAFDATIGGFKITDKAIYSGVKSSVDNTTRGIYQDKDGQLAVGDGSNYLKYFKDGDGKYKLEISAASLKFSASNKNLETVLGDTITKTVEEFYLSSSPTLLSGGSWSTKQPTWTEGKYIWRRTAVTYGDGSSEYTPSTNGVCITGNTGVKGEDGNSFGWNLLRNSKNAACFTRIESYLTKEQSDEDCKLTISTTTNSGWAAFFDDIDVESNQDYTYSLEVISANVNQGGYAVISAGTSGNWGNFGTVKFTTPGKKIITFNSGDSTKVRLSVGLDRLERSLGNSITIKNIKLEKGSVATEWAPHPDDLIGATGPKGDVGAGGNIIRNGYGEYLDNTNFEGGTFYKGDCPDGAYGYFHGGNTERISFDPTRIYDLEFYARQHAGTESKPYFSIIPYDADGYEIHIENVLAYNPNLFYLKKDLNVGDTVVYFEDLSKWITNTTQEHQRLLLFFGYSDSTGYVYPDGTYSRYLYRTAYNDNSNVDKTNNTITLKAPWSGKVFKAGTCVGQTSSGGVYCYYGLIGVIPEKNWKKYTGVVYAGKGNGRYSTTDSSIRLQYAKKISVYLGFHGDGVDYSKISLRERVVNSIKSTAITYQAGASGTTAPTGTWSSTVPATDASKPYMWTKTVITYTDDTTSTSYSVGSTPDGVQVGGRNLLLNSGDLTKWTPESGTTVTADSDGWFKISTTKNSSWWSTEQDVTLEAGTYTMSGYAKTGKKAGCICIRRMTNSANIIFKGEIHNKFAFSFTLSESIAVKIHLGLQPTASGDYVYFKLPKLEKGNKATDWTPAPEDQVEKAKIISEINQSPEQISIKASKISLEGIVTANEKFKILEDGSMEATSAKISGEITTNDSLKILKDGVTAELSIGKITYGVKGYALNADQTIAISSSTQSNSQAVYLSSNIETFKVPLYLYGSVGQFDISLTTAGMLAGEDLAITRNAGINGSLRVGGNVQASKFNGQTWNWSGQGGQPNWLWGGNDGVNMYVWSPSNFSVNYANSSGAVNAGLYSSDTNTTVAANSWVTANTITLPAGRYIGMVFAKVPNTPGARMLMILSNDPNATNAGGYHISDDNNNRACCTVPFAYYQTGNITWYLRVYCSLSYNYTLHHGYYIWKIG